MIQQKAGFSIIEMTISIMISAILMTAALTIYNQISKGAVTVNRITQIDTMVMVLHNRLSTDLQGLTPLWFTAKQKEKSEDTSEQDNVLNKNTLLPKQPTNKKENNFLYAQSTNDQFNLLTFVTTNPLHFYADQQIRTARVSYVLKPDPAHPNHFLLMRKQEDKISSDFNIENLTSGSFDQIAHKITSCKIEYGFIEQSPEQRAKEPDKAIAFKFVSQWGMNNEEIEEKNKYKPILPDVLKLTIQIEYTPEQPSRIYELVCSIPTSQAKEIKPMTQKKQDLVWRNKEKKA